MSDMRQQEEACENHSGEVVKFVGYGTVIAFVLAWLMHYIGDAFGGMYVLEGILPVNESIWEHLKLAFYPSIVVTMLPWCDYVRRIEWKKRFVLATISAVLSQIIVWAGYYGLKYGFYLEGMLIDLLLLLVGLLFGLVHAAMISDDNIWECVKWLGIVYIIAMTVMNYIFAFAPLNLPIFIPPVQG
jgi:uncharacterized membrane protein YqaE (UPF0057 family)